MITRARNPMPADVESELRAAKVQGDYEERPAYQRNDYLGSIERAKSPDVRSQRITQMLEELARGGVYMKMAHAPSRKTDG